MTVGTTPSIPKTKDLTPKIPTYFYAYPEISGIVVAAYQTGREITRQTLIRDRSSNKEITDNWWAVNMGTPSQHQLAMTMDSLQYLSPEPIPIGYSLRHFKDGDEKSWESIIMGAFSRYRNFSKVMAADKYFRPERIIFACHSLAGPVATAAAWHVPNMPQDVGYLYMVGAVPSHTGRNLGYAVCAAALNQMLAEGKTSALLITDDFRLPAIKTYLRLGFQPKVFHPRQILIWDRVMSQLHTRSE